MKIVVNAITAEGMDINEELKASDLSLETEHAHYTEGVKVKAHVEKDKDVVNVNCNIKSRKRQTCSRCLLEFELPIEKRIDFVYQLTGEHVIILDDNIRDTIILDNPIKIVCKEDCKGLCIQCGKNLNEGVCGCKIKEQYMTAKSEIRYSGLEFIH